MRELRVGVFGGSFDPPHLGHTMVTAWALATRPLDEVWWIPTFRHAFGKRSAPFDERLRWCELAVRHFAGVRVDEIEGELGGESRTIDTLEALEARHPAHEFSLVVGADLVVELTSWKRWEDLQRYPLHVVGRGSVAAPEPGTISLPDISSSALREMLESGDQRAGEWMDVEVYARVSAIGAYVRGRE